MSIHGTAVALEGHGLLILGPSGSGKSGLAAGLIALGASLVADDRVDLRAEEGGALCALRPAQGPATIELRGLGLISAPLADAVPLAAILLLEPSTARLPDPETLRLADREVPLLRHPAHPELAAKLILWLRAAAA
jgi:HPr kinase/phosphorylase